MINRLESSALSLALAKQLAQRGIGIIIIDFFESEEDTDAILKQIGK